MRAGPLLRAFADGGWRSARRRNKWSFSMSDGRIFIGTRRYSSWSMRGWLPVALAGLDVTEVVIPLAGGSTSAVKDQTPSGLVPYLEHNGARIWESLAIIEYCAEFDQTLWPKKRRPRAMARAIAAEMHAGFRDLRQAMPMNLGREDHAHWPMLRGSRRSGPRRVPSSARTGRSCSASASRVRMSCLHP